MRFESTTSRFSHLGEIVPTTDTEEYDKTCLFQAHNCTDKALAQKMFLPLAERMTKKFVEDGKIEAEAGKWNK